MAIGPGRLVQLCLALIGRPLPLVGGSFALVGDPLPLVGDPLPLVGLLLVFVGGSFAPDQLCLAPPGSPLALVAATRARLHVAVGPARPAGLHNPTMLHPGGIVENKPRPVAPVGSAELTDVARTA